MRQVLLLIATLALACSPDVESSGEVIGTPPESVRTAAQSLDGGAGENAGELPARDAVLAAFRFDPEASPELIESYAGENLSLELRPRPESTDSMTATPSEGGILLQDGGYYLDRLPDSVYEALVDGDGFAVETWVRPDNLSQSGPARLITLSEDSSDRNFTLGQGGESWVVRFRWDNAVRDPVSDEYDRQGTPSLGAERPVEREIVHLVMTYDGNFVTLWIDGEPGVSAARPDGLGNWDPSYGLAVGNEFLDDRQWQGHLYSFTIYDRGLRPDEVARIYSAGRQGGVR